MAAITAPPLIGQADFLCDIISCTIVFAVLFSGDFLSRFSQVSLQPTILSPSCHQPSCRGLHQCEWQYGDKTHSAGILNYVKMRSVGAATHIPGILQRSVVTYMKPVTAACQSGEVLYYCLKQLACCTKLA